MAQLRIVKQNSNAPSFQIAHFDDPPIGPGALGRIEAIVALTDTEAASGLDAVVALFMRGELAAQKGISA
ncbi:MAG TPA: hypothetical protein VK663_01910 [Burkholderiales bacterium]|nr:hypothetical protein [Burkholderiales bacterium]